MAKNNGRVQHLVQAFLDGEDSELIANPIHSTVGARQFGYKGALVGGVTVYSWCCEALIEALGESWLDYGWAEFSFRSCWPRAPWLSTLVLPRIPPVGSCSAATTINRNNECNNFSNNSNTNDNSSDSSSCHSSDPSAAYQSHRPSAWCRSLLGFPSRDRLTLENAPVGCDICPRVLFVSQERCHNYATQFPRSTNPLWRNVVHPGWICGQMTPLIEHSLKHLPAIHTHTKVQHLKRIRAPQQIAVTGHFVKAYEHNNSHYAVVDGAMVGESGELLAQLQHVTIFSIGKKKKTETNNLDRTSSAL